LSNLLFRHGVSDLHLPAIHSGNRTTESNAKRSTTILHAIILVNIPPLALATKTAIVLALATRAREEYNIGGAATGARLRSLTRVKCFNKAVLETERASWGFQKLELVLLVH